MGVRSLSQEDPLEKEAATHSNTPAWEIPWTEEPGRLQSGVTKGHTGPSSQITTMYLLVSLPTKRKLSSISLPSSIPLSLWHFSFGHKKSLGLSYFGEKANLHLILLGNCFQQPTVTSRLALNPIM